jgi:hypothetical protein
VIADLYEGQFNNLAFLTKVKELNPSIKLLIYVQFATQDFQKTVGALELQKANPLAWLPAPTYIHNRAFANYRSFAWQDAIQSAVASIFAVCPLVDGIFLDNVAVWAGHVRGPEQGPAMARGLQTALTELRTRWPTKLFIGNSSSQWTDLNGEFNENRPGDWSQLAQDRRHTQPEMRMAHMVTSNLAEVATLYAKAQQMGLWFGATHDPSLMTVVWQEAYN